MIELNFKYQRRTWTTNSDLLKAIFVLYVTCLDLFHFQSKQFHENSKLNSIKLVATQNCTHCKIQNLKLPSLKINH